MGYWGLKSYEHDDAADALDAGFDRVHGPLYEDLMDDRNPLTFEEVQDRLANHRTLEAAIAALQAALPQQTQPDDWDDVTKLALAGIVVRHAELGVPIPRCWWQRALDWLERETLEWEELAGRRVQKQQEIALLRDRPPAEDSREP
jgi:hypothetical protein